MKRFFKSISNWFSGEDEREVKREYLKQKADKIVTVDDVINYLDACKWHPDAKCVLILAKILKDINLRKENLPDKTRKVLH